MLSVATTVVLLGIGDGARLGTGRQNTSSVHVEFDETQVPIWRCDRGSGDLSQSAQVPAVARGFKNLKYVGEGGNACVYLSEEPFVALKVSKWPGGVDWNPNLECKQTKSLHEEACFKGVHEAIQQYYPACTKIGYGRVQNEPSDWMLQQRAGGKHGKHILETAAQLPVFTQKSIYSQLVDAVRTLHKLGYAHNDLHDGNVMLDFDASWIHKMTLADGRVIENFVFPRGSCSGDCLVARLSIIDLGEKSFLWKKDAQTCKQGCGGDPQCMGTLCMSAQMKGYKRDALSIWDRAAKLANCKDPAMRDRTEFAWSKSGGGFAGWPEMKAKYGWNTQQDALRTARIEFLNCLHQKWFADDGALWPEFKSAWDAVLDAAEGLEEDQHVERLWNTQFVKQFLPAPKIVYPSSCDGKNPPAPVQPRPVYHPPSPVRSVRPQPVRLQPPRPRPSSPVSAPPHKTHHGRKGKYAVGTKLLVHSRTRVHLATVIKNIKHSSRIKIKYDDMPHYHVKPLEESDARIVFYLNDAHHCGGQTLALWSDGTFSKYGDHSMISLLKCADLCKHRPECMGFNVKTQTSVCAHWKGGTLAPWPNANVQCWTKVNS